MSTFSKEHWDADVKRFTEKYGADLCNIILKMIEGKDDKDIENLRKKYGAGFIKSIEALIADELKGEELRCFIAYRGEFYKDIQELVEKRAHAKGNIGMPHKKETIELQKLIELGKKKGFLTYNEINDALPQEGFSVEDMDRLLEMLGEMGIEVVESDDKARVSEKPPEEKIITPYKKGDFIGGKYEVYDILGMGGFGIVYLVYSHKMKSVFALKTLRDEYLEDREAQERFKKEAQIWIDMERHPYLVRAYLVDKISDRLFIELECISPGEDGLNSLDGYLRRRPPDLAQSLRWGIQFCYGMEYAYSKGIRAHRDIKPANILIGQDKAIKITDFGIAGVLGQARISGIKMDIRNNTVGFSCQTVEGSGFGTPTHMPPEQFINAAACDERSDIYSFGIVLYQMAACGSLPFLPNLPGSNSDDEHIRFWHDIYRLHSLSPVPRLNSPLFHIIQRCLEKEPKKRYQSFRELRSELEPLLKRLTGEVIKVPEQKELENWEWHNKGFSLYKLGKHQEAIASYDRAIEIEPRDERIWHNKGLALSKLGKYQEAIVCFDMALEIEPRDADAWYTKGNALKNLGKLQGGINCYDRAIEINPRYAGAWISKGYTLSSLGEYQEAIVCYDRAIEMESRDELAWYSKGLALSKLGKHQEAIVCFDRALEINPRFAGAWNDKGNALSKLGRHQEAIACHDRAIEIDPRYVSAWIDKGLALSKVGKYQEEIACYDRALEIDPRDAWVWHFKGVALSALGRHEEAIACYDKVIEIGPRHAWAWNRKGVTLSELGKHEEAIEALENFIKFAPAHYATNVAQTKELIQTLKLRQNRK